MLCLIYLSQHTISTVKECQTRREEQKMEFEEAEAVKTRADVVSYAMMGRLLHNCKLPTQRDWSLSEWK